MFAVLACNFALGKGCVCVCVCVWRGRVLQYPPAYKTTPLPRGTTKKRDAFFGHEFKISNQKIKTDIWVRLFLGVTSAWSVPDRIEAQTSFATVSTRVQGTPVCPELEYQKLGCTLYMGMRSPIFQCDPIPENQGKRWGASYTCARLTHG